MIKNSEKKAILDSFLRISGEKEINSAILSDIAKDCEISESKIKLLFEDGVVGIIEFYLNSKLEELSDLIKNDSDFSNKKVRERVSFCLFKLFELQKDDRKSAKSIKKFYFDLGNLVDHEAGIAPAVLAVKNAYNVADRIWILLGDKSTDHNYYTKRLTLSKVVTKVFFAFIDDESEDLSKTSDMIDKEIDNVMKFEKFKKEAKDFCGKSREEIASMISSKDGKLRPISDIVKNIPFIRLFN